MRTGYTLVELIITIAIVGILATIAYPSYTAYIKRANRTDATRAMTQSAQQLERCYSQAFTYAGCATAPPGPTPSAQGYYGIAINVDLPTHFTITATPIAAPQLNDTACAQFTLSSAGTQGATDSGGSSTTQTCWGSM